MPSLSHVITVFIVAEKERSLSAGMSKAFDRFKYTGILLISCCW